MSEQHANPENELPLAGTRCTDVLRDTLTGYAGVYATELDMKQGSLRIQYDPQQISPARALNLVQHAGQEAWERINQCSAKSPGACSGCLLQLRDQMGDYLRTLAQVPLQTQTEFTDGVMEIRLNGNTSGTALSTELSQVERRFAEPAETPAGPVPAKEQKPWLTTEQFEIVLTSLTALSTLLAFLGETFGWFSGSVVTVLYVTAYIAGGYFGTIEAVEELVKERRLSVDLLMILAAVGAAFIGQPAEGATLLFLFSLSNTLQSYAMDRSRKAIAKLLDLRPPTATVRRGSRLVTLPVEQLVLGDVALVKPGERFPIDGQILSGTSTADQATITGESTPVAKEPGDNVFAGTVNGNGGLEIRVTHLAKDTTLARIVTLVEEAQANKARTQSTLDNFEQVYALLVLAGAGLLIAIPLLLLNHEFTPTFYRAMTWLVVASPCALVISTPASFLSAIANGAKRGILFKGGVHLEQTAALKVVAFDKTGTLTVGKPSLTRLQPAEGLSETELLRLTAAAEGRSEHPLAAAIVRAAEARGIQLPSSEDFQAITGQGIEAIVENHALWIGNERLFEQRRVQIPANLLNQAREWEKDGQTVMLAYNHSASRWLGILAVADTLRSDAAEIVQGLKQQGIERVVMLTGDNPGVAASIAQRSGVDEYHAGLLPQDKVRLLKTLKQQYGTVAMVGDGVNDAPALASADLGIAMGGAGADVALETADVVLMGDDLNHLPYAIGLARKARQIVWQNITFALAVIVLLVISSFGANLPLPLGVVGHEGSTVIVVLNGLRLLGYRSS